jgi:hypothetical protein
MFWVTTVDTVGWRLVFVIPMIVGLVELARRAGLGPASASALAIALGLAVRLAYAAAGGTAEPSVWVDAVVQGLTIGVSASGLAAKIRQSEKRL